MIYLDHSNIDQSDIDMVNKAMREGQVSTAGRYVEEFEDLMREYFGRNVVALNSGTAALFLALKAHGVRKGTEIHIPALTFVGTYNAIVHAGCVPVVRDVDRFSWSLSLQIDMEVFPPMTLPVDLYGNIADSVPGRFPYIKDAAESFGSTCSLDGFNVGVYSFNGNKIITTGGGGLYVGDKAELVWKLAHQGKHDGVATNMGMTSLSAALGISQFRKLDHFLELKRMYHETYLEQLGPYVQFQKHNENSTYWLNCCLLPGDIPTIQKDLADRGIQTRRIFKPLGPRDACPNAWYIYDHGICLPSSTLNRKQDILTVCKEIKDIVYRQNHSYNRGNWISREFCGHFVTTCSTG